METANDGDFIYTQYGKFFLDKPEFAPEAISHSLAQMPRWTGHTDRNVTCGEHACLVAGIMLAYGTGNPLEGLLCDAPDAYMGHIAKPWKQRLPDFVKLWNELDQQIRTKWGLPASRSADCSRANDLATSLEAYSCFADHGLDIPMVRDIIAATHDPANLKWRVHGVTRDYPWQFWDHLWMKAYNEFKPKIEVVEGDVDIQVARAQSGDQAPGHAVVVP